MTPSDGATSGAASEVRVRVDARGDRAPEWLDIAPPSELAKRKKLPVEHDGHHILVISHEGGLYAFHNICIHRERELTKGVILNNKLVCPGHQWAFVLSTGWEAVKEQAQPTYDVRVEGDMVQVDLNSCRARADDGS